MGEDKRQENSGQVTRQIPPPPSIEHLLPPIGFRHLAMISEPLAAHFYARVTHLNDAAGQSIVTERPSGQSSSFGLRMTHVSVPV